MIRGNPRIHSVLYQEDAPLNLSALWLCQQNNVRSMKIYDQGAWQDVCGGEVNYYAVYTTSTLPTNPRDGATCWCSDIKMAVTYYSGTWYKPDGTALSN